MPLLIIVLLAAILLWLLLSAFFDKIGGAVIKLYNRFIGKLKDNNGEEKNNE